MLGGASGQCRRCESNALNSEISSAAVTPVLHSRGAPTPDLNACSTVTARRHGEVTAPYCVTKTCIGES